MFGSAILLAAVLWSAEGGGNVAAKLGTQVPFSAAEGFVVEARMNRSDDPRHPCGLSLVSVGEGPVIALGGTATGLDISVTDVKGGRSTLLARYPLSLPANDNLSTLRCRIGYDAGRQVIWCTIGDADDRRIEFPAPMRMCDESYRLVPSQVPGALKVSVNS